MQATIIASALIGCVILTGCNMPLGETISEDQAVLFAMETLEARQLTDQPNEDPAQEAPSEGETPLPSETPIPVSPTITFTPSPSVPMVTVSTATNCRSGPALQYDYLGALNPNQIGTIVAQSSVGSYVVIQNPGSGPDCWLWLRYGTVSGDLSGLPLLTPPPSPTPAPVVDWTGSWATDSGASQFTVNLTQTGNIVSAVENVNAITLTINGTVSDDSMTVNGLWSQSDGNSGTFVWQLLPGSIDQFNGSWVNVPGPGGNMWCGWRNGAAMPVPCLGP